jgi:hypothetical protein
MYPSLLGSGLATCMVILFLQISLPALLLAGAMTDSSRFSGLFQTTAEEFCPRGGVEGLPNDARAESLAMNLLIIILYGLRIAPKVNDVFFQAIGEGWSASSKLNSLRYSIWRNGNDTFSMQVGFRIERLIKAFYMCTVSLLMLFVLFMSDSALDIVLNALAIEFIWEFDVAFVRSPFWDHRRRWIKAAAVECQIRANLDLESLSSPKKFCAEFGISLNDYMAAFDGRIPKIRDRAQAEKDSNDDNYMTETDLVWSMAGKIGQEKHMPNVLWQFASHTVAFGWFDNVLIHLGLTKRGIFQRFRDYRTWSVWEKLLYLPPVPNQTFKARGMVSLFSVREDMNISSSKDLLNKLARHDSWTALRDQLLEPANQMFADTGYLNFHPFWMGLTAHQRFILDIIRTLCFITMSQSLYLGFKRGMYWSLPFRFLDGMLEWFSYIVQVSFPFALVAVAVLNILCY